MQEENSYIDIHALSKRLLKTVEKLNAGQLNLEDVEASCDDARELYERLLIFRYEAHKPKMTSKPKKEEVKSPEQHNIPFKVEPPDVPRNQTSLIDAIEEVSEVKEVKKDIENAFFPLPELEPEAKPESKAEPLPEPKPEKVKAKKPKKEKDPKPQIAESLALTEEESLVEKMGAQKINNLKSFIGLNQKFQFINELFDGESEKYNQAIETIDAQSTEAEAIKWMNANVDGFEALTEHEVKDQLLELISRRFI